MRIERTATGFIVARVGQQGENFDWTEMVTQTPAPYCRLDIPYPAAAGPGGPFRIIGFTTPVDEQSCLVFFWRMRRVTGLAREVWRFLYRATLEQRHCQGHRPQAGRRAAPRRAERGSAGDLAIAYPPFAEQGGELGHPSP